MPDWILKAFQYESKINFDVWHKKKYFGIFAKKGLTKTLLTIQVENYDFNKITNCPNKL